MSKANVFKVWKYTAVIGGFIGAVCLAMYPIAVDPYLNPQKWQTIQNESRQGIDRETIQPGGMKIWSDPFDKPK